MAKIVDRKRRSRFVVSVRPAARRFVLIVALALVACVVAVAILLIRRDEAAEPKPQEDTKKYRAPTESAPQSVSAVVPATNATPLAESSPISNEPAKPEPETPSERPARPLSRSQAELQKNYVYPTPGQARLDSGYILTFKPPEEGHAVRFFKEGKFYWCYADGTFEAVERKPVFDDPFEEQLVGLATPGATFVPSVLLNHSEEELREMLSRPVVINEDDSEEIAHKKETVAEMKKILSDYLQEGGAYSDFIREMHEYSKEERRLRSNGVAKAYELVERGDLEAAREFVESYNAILGENNFNPLKLPKRLEAQLYGDTENNGAEDVR